ncbi:MAG: DNA polymerase III subunit beta [Streptococcaceae bacterium]|jgi:DNA polymerase-3 subunit beta|nr:DNA polymerase III subunit beta [Streptococcaceae bacterium]
MLKFRINKNTFLANLRLAQKAITGKIVIPVLNFVKIDVSSEGMTLIGSNGKITIETFLAVDNEDAGMVIEETGGILLEVGFFSRVVSSLPDYEFTLQVLDNNVVNIISGQTDLHLNGMNVEDYPQIKTFDQEKPLKMPVSLFKNLIQETNFAASTQESRPILTGVCFKLADNQNLIATATDAHRMTRRVIQLPNPSENFQVVIPSKSLKEFTNVFSNDEQEFEMLFSDTQVQFRTETISLYTRLLDGNYPDTERIIPKDFNTTVVFDSFELRQVMNRAALLTSNDRSRSIQFDIKQDKITLFGNSPEIGNIKEDVAFETFSGKDLLISFNPVFMSEALTAFGEGKIVIKFTESIRPFILSPESIGEQFIQLITPIRTNASIPNN